MQAAQLLGVWNAVVFQATTKKMSLGKKQTAWKLFQAVRVVEATALKGQTKRHHVLQRAEKVGQKKLGTWSHGATWASAAPFKTKAAGQISRAERTARDRSCWCAEVSAGMCVQRANACMHRCRAVRTICPARLRASKTVAYLCHVGVLPAHIPGACLLVYVV
jgi:hypothetical protein